MSDPELLSVKPYSQREREMADEIERLTADLQDYKDLYYAEQKVAIRLQARVDKLEKALFKYAGIGLAATEQDND